MYSRGEATTAKSRVAAGISQNVEIVCRSKLRNGEGRSGAAKHAAAVATDLLNSPSIKSNKKDRLEALSLIQLAENIKSGKFGRTKKEEIILLQSSKIGALKFLEWEKEPSAKQFEGEEYTDPVKLRLSREQEILLDGWKRAPQREDAFKAIRNIDLAQEGVTDCSIVASMCAAINMEERGLGQVLSRNIYPQLDGSPSPSKNRKYVVRLYINGCFRRVEIDDFLPSTSVEGKSLHVIDRANPSLVWPALIEKAYLKVMGGYDFPGSNCGMDLLALTGWIPEYIFLEADNINSASLWKRMHSFWNEGNVLITLGTGKLSESEEMELGLVSQHDYAVIGLKEFDGRRMLLVKNPWSKGAVWRGPAYNHRDDSDSDDGLACDQDSDEDARSDGSDSDFDAPEREALRRMKEEFKLPSNISADSAVFWIDLNSVCLHFRSVYLNWRPEMFPHREDVHFQWDITSKTNPSGSLQTNPQYALSSPHAKGSQLVWLLLQRHIIGSTEAEKYTGNGYISLYVFENSGNRVIMNRKPLIRGHYVDSTHTLLKIENMPKDATYTVVVCSEDLAFRQHRFTISTFSMYPLALEPAREELPHKCTSMGSWTQETAGGNVRCEETFRFNPQFRLRVGQRGGFSKDAKTMLVIESPDHLNIQIMLVWSNGERIDTATTRNIICSSGEYRKGCAIAETKDLQCPGDYTVVASTFEAGEVGTFTMTVRSEAPVELTALPSHAAGKIIRRVENEWGTYSKISYPIKVHRLITISASIKGGSKSAAAAPPLKVFFTAKKYEHVPFEILGDHDEDDFSPFTGEVDVSADWKEIRMVIERSGGTNGDYFVATTMADGFFEIGEERRDD